MKENIDRLYNDILRNQSLMNTPTKPYEFPDEADGVDPKVMDYYHSRLKSNRHSDFADALMYSMSCFPKLPWYKILWIKLKRKLKRIINHD